MELTDFHFRHEEDTVGLLKLNKILIFCSLFYN